MQPYFTRVSRIKEQLEDIGNMVEEVEIVMNTLNGLPRDWEKINQRYVLEESSPSSTYFGRSVCTKKEY